jgi:acyl phosphate:glycerol-3-phosphate acyltransferase
LDTSQIIIALIVGYAFGSVPFGLLLTKFSGAGDIRSVGSGNIGATNVLRTGRKGLAAGTLLGDMLKGTAAVLLMRWWGGSDAGLLAALGAVVGHIFPVWLKFKGGKGVATYIGVLIVVSWIAALIFGVVWGVVAYTSRYSSLSGLTASALTPVALAFLVGGKAALLFSLLTALVWYMHRANIQRLLAGTESKIGQPKADAPQA